MTLRKKKYLFIGFVILFFISVPVVVLFTEGYRLDFEEWSVVKTGGVDLDITTRNAMVFIDGELEDETNFLFQDVIVRNIIPKTYNFEVAKEGYHSWEKSARVTAGKVTQFIDIRLFPKELERNIIKSNVVDTYSSPHKNFILLETQEITTSEGTPLRTLTILDTHKQKLIPVFTLKPDENVDSVRWSSEERFFSLVTTEDEQKTVYAGEITDDNVKLKNWDRFLRPSYPEAYNENSQIIPALSTEKLYILIPNEEGILSLNIVNISEGTIRPNIVRNIAGFDFIGNDIFYLSREGVLTRTDVESRQTEELSPTAITRPKTGKVQISVRGDKNIINILNEDELFLWMRNKPLQKVEEGVVDISYAPNNKKMLYWTQEKAVVYWFEEVFGPPKRDVRDVEVITKDNLKEAEWLTNASGHIALRTDNTITLAELDGRDNRNTVTYDIATDKLLSIRKDRHRLTVLNPKGTVISIDADNN